jgi:S-adenosylmethionine synthetase
MRVTAGSFLRPDARARYRVHADGVPVKIHTVVFSTQHDECHRAKDGRKAGSPRGDHPKLVLPTLKAERPDLA